GKRSKQVWEFWYFGDTLLNRLSTAEVAHVVRWRQPHNGGRAPWRKRCPCPGALPVLQPCTCLSRRSSGMPRTIQAPRGTQLTCKNWQIEAAYRMLQNNLDPQVAFDPDNLIVYGGRGRAARNWEAFEAILAALRDLQPDETLLVQSGK